MRRLGLALCLAALGGCVTVSKSKQAQVQTAFNQQTAHIHYNAIQRAAAASR
ncbi:MAG: hypothetical protein PHC88_10670 [Terrimicrobiaceae bacterium]|nr:hypothetical protein [Terrimicrobiaceae bacterium]